MSKTYTQPSPQVAFTTGSAPPPALAVFPFGNLQVYPTGNTAKFSIGGYYTSFPPTSQAPRWVRFQVREASTNAVVAEWEYDPNVAGFPGNGVIEHTFIGLQYLHNYIGYADAYYDDTRDG